MTLLNPDRDGFFSVLISLVRATIVFGAVKDGKKFINKETLLHICGLGADPIINQNHLKNTLEKFIDLGLFYTMNNDIGLSNSFTAKSSNNFDDLNRLEKQLPKAVRNVLFDPKNNEEFWNDKSNSDFSRAISWLLAQDSYELDWSTLDRLQREQLSYIEKKIFLNDTRLNHLKHWGVYLGFINTAGGLVVDPTEAVRSELPVIFDNSSRLSARDFVEKLSHSLPVLDGGKYRVEVEKNLNDKWSRQPEDWVSTSLSRALMRLDFEGYIKFEIVDDATKQGRVLTGFQKRRWKRVTYINLLVLENV